MQSRFKIAGACSLLAAAILLSIVNVSDAWIRFPRSDAEIVSHAELIVVGAVKSCAAIDGRFPENHLELQVSEFIKGTNGSQTIVVCVPWGLTPVIGGYYSNRYQMVNARMPWHTNYPNDVIEVFDTGNSIRRFEPFTGDIRTNHIWLLWRKPSYPYVCRSNLLSVYDPEDIQPVRKKADLIRHLERH